MLNRAQIIGRLGRDPELKYSNNGAPFCSFSVATDESYADRDGQKIKKTEWHNIVVFQRLAEACAKYLNKGSLVYVEGNLQTRKWQAQDGGDRYTTEIRAQRVQFLDTKQDNQGQRQSSRDADDDPAFQPGAAGMDDVPFN